MSEKPPISIIIPVYNVNDVLDYCVQSVVDQTYQNLDIILINDGSTDGSASLCDAWGSRDKRIRVIHQPNKGLSGARNTGITHARGDYIYFIDSDDWIDSSTIEDLYRVLIAHDAQIAISNYYAYDDVTKQYHFFISDKDYFERCFTTQDWFDYAYSNSRFNLYLNFILSWNKLIDKQLFDYGISFPDGRSNEDEGTTYKFYLVADRIVYMNRAHYAYRQRDNTLSKQTSKMERPGSYAEEMLALMTLAGLDTNHVMSIHTKILEVASERALSTGNIDYYHLAEEKLKLCQNLINRSRK